MVEPIHGPHFLASFAGQLPPLLPTPPRPRFKHLSEAEIAERRECLCFNCDQKFSRSHRCKGRFLLVVAEGDDDEPTNEDLGQLFEPDDSPGDLSLLAEAQPAQLSLNALCLADKPQKH